MVETEMKFLQVVIALPEALADAACGIVMQQGARGVEVRDSETGLDEARDLEPGRAEVRVWLSPDTDAEALSAHLTAKLGPEVSVRFATVDAEDWVRKVREQVQPVDLGRRLRVRPTWHEAKPGPEDMIEIVLDPGLAFGTGSHATTSLCMEALETAVDERRRLGRSPSVLDVGTGSGILCILGARLGASSCHGIDNDPMAVKVAAENARANGVDDRCTFDTEPPFTLNGVYDLVLANIQLGVLLDLADGVAPRVAPGGELYLSGLLVDQAEEAETAYAARGLTPAGRAFRDGWALVRLVRPVV